jgi:hypothetical protein
MDILTPFIPLLLFFTISASLPCTRRFAGWFIQTMNPINWYKGTLFRGTLLPESYGGSFVPGKRPWCKSLCYLIWLSILCETIMVARFVRGRYGTTEKFNQHYYFDETKSDFVTTWPDDLTITYIKNGDGTGQVKINRQLPFELKLPGAITENLNDLTFAFDLRFQYEFDSDVHYYGTFKPVVKFETLKQHNERMHKNKGDNEIALLSVVKQNQESTVIIGGVLDLPDFENHMNPVWSFLQLICLHSDNEYICTKGNLVKMSHLLTKEITTMKGAMFGSFVLIWFLSYSAVLIITIGLILLLTIVVGKIGVGYTLFVIGHYNNNGAVAAVPPVQYPLLCDYFHIIVASSTPASLAWCVFGPSMLKNFRDMFSLGKPSYLYDCVTLFFLMSSLAIFQSTCRQREINVVAPPQIPLEAAPVAIPAVVPVPGHEQAEQRPPEQPQPAQPQPAQPQPQPAQPQPAQPQPAQPQPQPQPAQSQPAQSQPAQPQPQPQPPVEETVTHLQQPSNQVSFSIPPVTASELPPSSIRRRRLRSDSSPLLKLSKSMHHNKNGINKDGDKDNKNMKNMKSLDTFLSAESSFLYAPKAPQTFLPDVQHQQQQYQQNFQQQAETTSIKEIELKWSLWYAKHQRNMLILARGGNIVKESPPTFTNTFRKGNYW